MPKPFHVEPGDRTSRRPIGIFDSGLGGLTIVREVRHLLPNEDILFLADQANVPYGTKSEAEILTLTRAAVPTLIAEGAKAVVVACNTASASILEELRERYADTAFIGLIPALKPAIVLSKRGTAAVFATDTTLRSAIYRELKAEHAKNTKVIDIPCPEWVRMVEAGTVREEALEAPVRQALAAGADVFVLGCTHFPFLREPIARLAGGRAELVDSGPAIARQLRSVLTESARLNRQKTGTVRFMTSGDAARASEVASRLTGRTIRFQTVGH